MFHSLWCLAAQRKGMVIKMNEYFSQNDVKRYAFYRVPKALFTEETYNQLSTDAKMLYGLLLDRMSLSLKKWMDG